MLRLVPPEGEKTMPCRVCGKPMLVSTRKRKPPRCLDCGIQAAIDQQTQMRNRSGPYYEAYLAAAARSRAFRDRGTPEG